MKTKQILPWLMMFFIGMVSSPVLAQSYDQLWKEVETYQKKDLPKSVMATAGKIYEKAKKERNYWYALLRRCRLLRIVPMPNLKH